MIAQGGGGSIVSTASVAGVGAGNGPAVYSVAKGAVIHLTKVAAYELGEHNIRVNCICPGGIATPIFGKSLGLSAEEADKTVEAMAEVMGQAQPIRRSGRPADIAHAALWLSSDDSSSSPATPSSSTADSPSAAPAPENSTSKSAELFDALGIDRPAE